MNCIMVSCEGTPSQAEDPRMGELRRQRALLEIGENSPIVQRLIADKLIAKGYKVIETRDGLQTVLEDSDEPEPVLKTYRDILDIMESQMLRPEQIQ